MAGGVGGGASGVCPNYGRTRICRRQSRTKHLSVRKCPTVSRRSIGSVEAFTMDPEAFLDIANQVIKLKMFPYFDIAHCTLCALSIREDLGSGESKNPAASSTNNNAVLTPNYCRKPIAIPSIITNAPLLSTFYPNRLLFISIFFKYCLHH